jgi:UDP-N-acetylmuramoyl-tripeptide--D-alanyl-D-alanine ligase
VPELTAARVAEITGGRLVGDGSATANSMVHDSRNAADGVAFAAVAEGNDFVRDALAAGAPFAIVERDTDVGPVVVVPDTMRALGDLATAVRREMSVDVVGITGSTGKTITKDLVATVLGVRYRVHATPKSLNQEIGVPLVVLGCPPDTEVMVSELGARHVGDIAYLCSIVRPRTGIITGIGITHLEEFGSRAAIARTKSELLRSLPADGVAIVPSDDDYLPVLSASTDARVRTVGPGASISYRAERIDTTGHTHGVVTVDGHDVGVVIPIAGRALMRNVALAIACGVEHGVDPDEAARAIAGARVSSFRMEIVEVGGWTIINDAYNANPTSVSSALRSAKEMAGGRALWAVLGPMAELGPASEAEHRRIGRLSAALGYDGIIAIGEEGAEIARGAGDLASRVGTTEEAADAVIDAVPSGALVMVKASRVVSLERFPEMLMARTNHVSRKA